METVTNKIQNFRQKQSVTQVDLADAIGVSRQTIIAVEKGHYTPSVCLALKLAEYFHRPVETLFQLVNNKN
jgi:putative transcriptional regulator